MFPTDTDTHIHLATTANVSRLTDTLWTGGDLPSDRNAAVARIRIWQTLGIRRVVDCRIEWTDQALVTEIAPEIEYLYAGVDDAGQVMPDSWFTTITDFAARDTGSGDDGLLVHCHMGINRGPSGAYAVLLSRGIDPVEAIDLIRGNRPIAAVSYAEDALAWWHRTTGASPSQRDADASRLAQWRHDNGHDTARIIRQIRTRGN